MVGQKSKNFAKDLKKVRKFSSMIESRFAQFDKNDENKIKNLTFDQLQDLHQLTSTANFILSKYEDNKEVYSLLKDFVDMINNSMESMDLINDNIIETVVSAESAISRIKNLQGDVSENFSLISSTQVNGENTSKIEPKTSRHFLTNSATPVYT
jgi:phosphomevalonate kinase